MTINELKKRAKSICEHMDPSGKPIDGYFDENENMYYITYSPEVNRDGKEYVAYKKSSDIKDNLLFDPFSEFKMMNKNQY